MIRPANRYQRRAYRRKIEKLQEEVDDLRFGGYARADGSELGLTSVISFREVRSEGVGQRTERDLSVTAIVEDSFPTVLQSGVPYVAVAGLRWKCVAVKWRARNPSGALIADLELVAFADTARPPPTGTP